MLTIVQMVQGDIDRIEKVKKHRDDSNSNNHDVHGVPCFLLE
jgi:hypothetical protein